jgi:signal transduction histidine kinase
MTTSPIELPPDNDTLGKLLHQMAYLRNRDYARLIALAEEAVPLAESLNRTADLCKSLYFMAWGYLRQGDFSKAALPAKRSLELATRHQLPIEEGFALSALAAVYLTLSQSAEGLELLLRQRQIAITHQHLYLVEMATHDIATCYMVAGQLDEALQLFHEDLRLIDEHGFVAEKSMTLLNMGTIYTIRHDYAEALPFFQQSLQVADQEQILEGQILALTYMVESYAYLNQLDEAKRWLSEAERRLASFAQPVQESRLRLARGRIFRQMQDWEQAAAVLEQALHETQEHDDVSTQVMVLDELASLLAETGDYRRAFDYLRRHHETNERMIDEQSRARNDVLRLLYETEAVQKEAELQRLRREVAERELEEYKRAEAERRETERLQLVLEQERELTATKERILTRVNHEFRTPLAIIRTATDLLTYHYLRLSEAKREYHQRVIQEQFARIEQQLNAIGMVLHVQHGAPSEAPAATALPLLSQKAIHEAQQQTQMLDRVDLVLDTEQTDVRVDASILCEIVTQLLTNALKFSQQRVLCIISIVETELVIRVIDQGIGIPPDETDKVFEPLYRASNIDEIRGNGLGLTIVRDYVALLRGHVQLESRIGHGTTVTVAVPLG